MSKSFQVILLFVSVLTTPVFSFPMKTSQPAIAGVGWINNTSAITAPTNDSKNHEYNFENIDVGLTVCFITISLISVLGNTLVIHVVRTTPSMYTSVNLYIANMAFSDIISTIICTVVTVKMMFQFYSWIEGLIGLVLCRLVYFFFYSSFACSTFNLVAIAIDRYLAVKKPLYRYSFKTVKITIAVIWAASAMLSLPIINGYVNEFEFREENGLETTCHDMDRGDVYATGVTIMVVVCYIMPLIGATVLYTLTGSRLRNRVKSTIGFNDNKRQEQARDSAFKATKLMVTIVAAFAVCWAPFFIYHMAKAWYRGQLHDIMKWYYRPVCFLLASMNGTINPCLYLWFNSNFRKAFRKALLCSDKKARIMNLELQECRRKSRARTLSSTRIVTVE